MNLGMVGLPQCPTENGCDFRHRPHLDRQVILFTGMHSWLMQRSHCHARDVFCGDPAQAASTCKRMQRSRASNARTGERAPQAAASQHILHEHAWRQMSPAKLAPLDVALDELVPTKVRQVGIVRSPCAHVHDMAYACELCLIDDNLALVQHLHRITCQQKNAVNPLDRAAYRVDVRQIKLDRSNSLGTERLTLGFVADTGHHGKLAGLRQLIDDMLAYRTSSPDH